MNSKQLKSVLPRNEFMSFQMTRRNDLVKKRNKYELAFESILNKAMGNLNEKYRFQTIPQKSKFIPKYGLVYADFLVRVIHKNTTYGRKAWIEIDEPYHESLKQKSRDIFRQKGIVKKFRNSLLFLRYKTQEMLADGFVLKLTNDLDWYRG